MFSASSTRTVEQLNKWQSIWWINMKDGKFLILWRPHFTRQKPFPVGFFSQLLPSHIININKNPISNKILNKYKFRKNQTKFLFPSCHKFASSFSHFLHPLDLAMWRISLQSEQLEVSSSFFSFLFLRKMEQKKNQTKEQLSTKIKMKLLLKIKNKYTRWKKIFLFVGII